MNENVFKEGLKNIQYVKGKAPVFEIPSYNIKSRISRVKTGEYIHVVENEMFNWAFNVSPIINDVFFISP